MEHREQLRYYPNELYVPDVDKLMYCPILLRYFKENYLSLYGFELGMVSNQALVAQFLKSTSFHCLDIGKMCNLEQEFFDEIADFLTVAMLRLNDRALRPLRDSSFFESGSRVAVVLHWENF